MINEIETSFWKDKLNWKIFIILWKKKKDKVRNESVTNLILFAWGAASQMLSLWGLQQLEGLFIRQPMEETGELDSYLPPPSQGAGIFIR